eukprot:86554-Pyramimonas_sp.AAC.1
MLELIKNEQSDGVPAPKDLKGACRAANAARGRAKLAIMVDLALDNIANDPKTASKDIRGVSQAITDASKKSRRATPEDEGDAGCSLRAPATVDGARR